MSIKIVGTFSNNEPLDTDKTMSFETVGGTKSVLYLEKTNLNGFDKK